MDPRRPQSSSLDLLRLVQLALDEFDSVSVEATVRRVVRIANLMGDTFMAVRLGLDLKASGGHPPSNAEMTRRLMSNVADWDEPGGIADQAVDLYMGERQMDDGKILAHSLSEIDFWQRHRLDRRAMTAEQYAGDIELHLKMSEIVTRTKHHAFTLLCRWERELTFATNQGDALTSISARVDRLLSQQAPDALDMFNAAFRRLREANDHNGKAMAAEELSQALTSCRRMLKAVVDVVQPADSSKPESADGHPLTDEHYKNRLVEFLKARVPSGTFRSALVREGESLFERFRSTDDLASKGVHASVALEEAEFCALHTYLLAAEVLLLAQTDVPAAN